MEDRFPAAIVLNAPYQSALPGLVWPALPAPRQAAALALVYQMEQSQWWPGERIAAQQFSQLQALFAHAHGGIPFYRERLAAAGFSPAQQLTPDMFGRVPLLRRENIRSRGAELGAVPPQAHGQVSEAQSSGSTGTPITIRGTQLTGLFWNALTLREHLWQRRDLTATLAAIRYAKSAPPPAGQMSGNWGAATEGLVHTGAAGLLHIACDLAQQMEWLCRLRPAYLLSYPSNILALARYALERGIALPGLREVRSMGESLGPDVRAACREAWGVSLTDIYSATETGYLALQCPGHEHYHVQSESVLLEVLDEQGNACRPGETGRVVVTTLHNFAMPLIRYEIGDYAEVGPPCACGRGLPVLTRILGRSRNLVVLPDGSRHWPSFPADAWAHIGPIRQLQLVQHDLRTIEVRLVAERCLTPAEEQAFAETMAQRFGHPFAFAFRYLERIERSPGGKYEDFLSLVP